MNRIRKHNNRWRQYWRRGCRDEQGGVFVEFALLAPIFLMLLFSVVEYSLVMYATAVVESSLTNASRLGKTGFTQAGQSRQDLIYQLIRDNSAGLLDANNITITSRSYGSITQIGDPEPFMDSNANNQRDSGETYTDINGNGQWDADMGTVGLGSAGDIVVYNVSYPWPIISPLIRPFIGSNGTFTISSNVVVRNEPYNTVTVAR